MVEVESKQHLDPLLMELKESSLRKSNESFSQGGNGVLRYQARLCVPDVNDLLVKIFKRIMSLDIPFIRVQPKCI